MAPTSTTEALRDAPSWPRVRTVATTPRPARVPTSTAAAPASTAAAPASPPTDAPRRGRAATAKTPVRTRNAGRSPTRAPAAPAAVAPAPAPALSYAPVRDPAPAPAHAPARDPAPAAARDLEPPVEDPATKRWNNLVVRTRWAAILVAAFVAVIAAGHAYIMALVLLIQVLSFREITHIGYAPSALKRLPWTRTTKWYFFAVANFFLYGESMLVHARNFGLWEGYLLSLSERHLFVCYACYILGIVGFVTTLRKGHYRFQFRQLAWTHMSIFFVVLQPHMIIENVFEGLIWFLLPIASVICNDTAAYITGMLFGRTPLTQLSPKKTWEGFVGGLIATLVITVLLSANLQQFEYLICPTLTVMPFEALRTMHCATPAVFVPATYAVRLPWGQGLVPLRVAPMQFHALAIAVFASVIAPFGGFFASGVKRAYDLKDFGDSIPGHGGITDRFDCQFLMGLFAYMYHSTFIKEATVATGAALLPAIMQLPLDEQRTLVQHLLEHLRAAAGTAS